MAKGYWKFVWDAFFKIHGVVDLFIGLVLTFLLWKFSSDFTLSLFIVIPIFVFLAIIIITLLVALYDSNKYNSKSLPNVLSIKKVNENISMQGMLFILEPSHFFAYDALVSLYYIDDGYERLFGIGTVYNVQEDGKIQVTFRYSIDLDEELNQKLSNNNSDILKKVFVKPNIPNEYIESFR